MKKEIVFPIILACKNFIIAIICFFLDQPSSVIIFFGLSYVIWNATAIIISTLYHGKEESTTI